jgi:simple sugar transport system ATP-binding protein
VARERHNACNCQNRTQLPETFVVETGDIPRLEIRALRKRFGPVEANDGLSLHVGAGEIVVILGENGAGKSTLLRCLAGMLVPDAGEIRVDGQRQQFRSPVDALRAGIGTVYQHFALVPTFSVAEQLRLAGWRPGLAHGPDDIGLDPDTTIDALPLGARQRVEIARALLSAGRVLLLDEPTSVLAPPEVEELFTALRTVRDRGVGIVLITHKLREALAIGDRIVVLRKGRVSGELRRSAGEWPNGIETTLITLMFGASANYVDLRPLSPTTPTGMPLLEVVGLCTGADAGVPLVDVSFTLGPGEVVGIAGVDGNGQRELAEALAGFRAPASGTIVVEGRSIGGSGPEVARQGGAGLLTDDRLGEGVVPSRSIAENLALTRLRDETLVRFGLLRRRVMRRDAAEQIQRFDVRPPDPDTPVATLSGGNVQKLVLARALGVRPRVLICLKPTSGLDARTTRNVQNTLRDYAREGRGVLLFSNEVEEAMVFGDRVGALYRGRLSPLVPPRETSIAAIGRFMVGAG